MELKEAQKYKLDAVVKAGYIKRGDVLQVYSATDLGSDHWMTTVSQFHRRSSCPN